MSVKGINFSGRQKRLVMAFAAAADENKAAAERGDTATMLTTRERVRLTRLAWIRIDDHLFPKGH